jgi:hypothetical protein
VVLITPCGKEERKAVVFATAEGEEEPSSFVVVVTLGWDAQGIVCCFS